MNPRLAVLGGPLKEKLFPFAGAELTIGREPSNHLHLTDVLVSRKHCVIRSEQGQFLICDLDSHNGTFVNGVPVKERSLQHADQIRIGESLFVFLLDDADSEAKTREIQFDARNLVTRSMVRLRQEDALYLQPEARLARQPVSERMAADLRVLLKISNEINSIRGMERLQRRLLELICEAVPAESGAIVLLKESGGAVDSTLSWSQREGFGKAVEISPEIAQQVAAERTALLSNDLTDNPVERGSGEPVKAGVCSLLAVPLQQFDKLLGILYLQTSNPKLCFDQHHLELAAGIASLAALAILNARHVDGLESENLRLREDIQLQHNMIGESPRMREVYQFVSRVAPTASTVLIYGESGTGKELIARAIHQNSPRAAKPFVAINCAALTETLLESELFGHEKGAFTGAFAQKKGKLEVADGGTLFLDEVAELVLVLQAKLLRAIQERQFERVGGTRSLAVDIRLIAATNKNLQDAVRQGSFRQDLYYRLNVVSLKTPLLQERREDIPLLANYFSSECAKSAGRRIKGISAEAREYLMSYDWPGNVRELQNAIERAVVLGAGDWILPEDLPEPLLEKQPVGSVAVGEYHHAVREAKRQIVQRAIEQARGSITQAARSLGLHPNNLHRLIRDLDLRQSVSKAAES
jgi:Nif-specific regulatory protein